ncbi:MAG: AbrB/MazE/SpoVT family DNA-binding domain-containing protein [Acidimicrobiales bacterium]
MTHRVGPKGQVVIPKELRDEFGIEPGDEVSFWRHGDHVAVAEDLELWTGDPELLVEGSPWRWRDLR